MFKTKNSNSWTGERLETHLYNETMIEHLHRYAIALEISKGKKVLDIASGEGYGSKLISEVALEVIGVDISKVAITNAQTKYKNSNNLKFIEGSVSSIPCEANYFDVVVSFETIEHHDKHDEMMQEIKRVLKNDGVLILSSPDKLNYNDKRNFQNQYHIKELYENEFKQLISKYFSHVCFYKQRSVFCSLIIPENVVEGYLEYAGNYSNVSLKKDFNPHYYIAIASTRIVTDSPNAVTVFRDDELQAELTKKLITDIKTSITYRLGEIILLPLKFFRKLVSRS